MEKNKKKYRHIYSYVCLNCGKTRKTYSFNRFKNEICTICEGKKVPENQLNLFGVKIKTDPTIPENEIRVVERANFGVDPSLRKRDGIIGGQNA